MADVTVGSKRKQMAHSRKTVNPLIDGRGGRRRMRGRLDVVERGGVQRQGATFVGLEKEIVPWYSFDGL